MLEDGGAAAEEAEARLLPQREVRVGSCARRPVACVHPTPWRPPLHSPTSPQRCSWPVPKQSIAPAWFDHIKVARCD